MKIVLAPDSFKESLTALQVCDAMARGVRAVLPAAEIVKMPLADGGEGTVHTLVASTHGRLITRHVIGPLGQAVEAEFGLLGDGNTAAIEMAAASGLPLVPPAQRNPLFTTTYGTGELISAALDFDVSKIIIGIGGSATHDCGTGMAQALGVRFYANENQVTDPMTGERLAEVTHIEVSDLDPRIGSCDISVACDVDNPLLGERGAARVYSPQKGATPNIVQRLERHTAQIINLIESETQPVRDTPGAGAAGGLGAGLMAFLNASLHSGIDTVLDACHFDERISHADLILTGEGKLDEQSAMGKTIHGVLKRAQAHGIPVIALGGVVCKDAEALYKQGLLSMFCICDRPMSLSEAMKQADPLVEKVTERIVRVTLRHSVSK